MGIITEEDGFVCIASGQLRIGQSKKMVGARGPDAWVICGSEKGPCKALNMLCVMGGGLLVSLAVRTRPDGGWEDLRRSGRSLGRISAVYGRSPGVGRPRALHSGARL